MKPRVKRSFRALSGRRIIVEGFSRRAPTFVAIRGGGDAACAWLAPAELKKLVEAARRILR